jgi:hypothetical protein
MKSGMQTYFLASYDSRSKALVTVKKIRDPRSGKLIPDPGSPIRAIKKYRILDPEHWF